MLRVACSAFLLLSSWKMSTSYPVIEKKMKILYRRALLDNLDKRSDVQLEEITPEYVPKNILEIMRTHEAFQASRSFGAQGLAEPEEYEKLVIEDENGRREFEYFNKGVWYIESGTEADSPVFQAFTHFMILLD